jgi:hypothetical protein
MLRAFADRRMPIRDILWGPILMHPIHHRGQLSLMCRLAGGTAPGILWAKSGGDGGGAGKDADGEGVGEASSRSGLVSGPEGKDEAEQRSPTRRPAPG